MKKYIKLLLIMFLLIMISGCNEPNKESTSYRHLFDDLYERNFKKAEKFENWGLDSEEPIKYITYDFTEGGREEIPDFVFEQKIMTSDEIARVILAMQKDSSETYFWRIEVIEFKSMDEAKKIMVQDDMENIYYARYQNIVYFLDRFASIYVHGNLYLIDGYCADKDSEVLVFPETELFELEELKIPDTFKYILDNAFNLSDKINISKIICGENLRRICDYAFMELEELKYFECNKNLISIGKGSFLNNPKLQMVILNEGLEYINDRAFAECPNLEYVVIPASVKEVGFEAFTSGIIYIEAEIIPDKWDQNFAGKGVKFYTGNEWEYNDEGIPTVINFGNELCL